MITLESLASILASRMAQYFAGHAISVKTHHHRLLFEEQYTEIEITCLLKEQEEEKEKQKEKQKEEEEEEEKVFFTIIQLDVSISYGIIPIVESFAGIGENLMEAGLNGLENFISNAFHVLLVSLFQIEPNHHVIKTLFPINHIPFHVISSHIGSRGTKEDKKVRRWLVQLQDAIANLHLEEGTHWMRLYFCQFEREIQACELLLNNQPYFAIQSIMPKFDWPVQQAFCSLRMFVILNHGRDFNRMIKLLGLDIEEKRLFFMLHQLGFSTLDIEKAIAWVPELFGLQLMQLLKVQGEFSHQGIIINKDDIAFEINLKEDSFYYKLYTLVQQAVQHGWNESLKKLAWMSATIDSFNNSLTLGSMIEDIQLEHLTLQFDIPSYGQ